MKNINKLITLLVDFGQNDVRLALQLDKNMYQYLNGVRCTDATPPDS